KHIIEDWNDTAVSYDTEVCIHQLFEQQVELNPDKTALILDDEKLSYQALNAKANCLARELLALGVGPDVPVGISVERSFDMIISLLAVLKAGGTYVPLDPSYPQERLTYMIEASGLKLLLTQNNVIDKLPVAADVNVLLLDVGIAIGYSENNIPNLVHPNNLAYIIFTSGSTGRPKGVCIDHASLARHTVTSIEMLDLTLQDTVLQFAVFSFDTFAEQLYPALCCGASVVLRGQELWGSEDFYQQVIEHNISVADLSSAYWHQIAREFAIKGSRDYGSLRKVTVGGEAMPPKGFTEWNKAGLSHVELLNAYGPTEATVTSTIFDCGQYVTGEQEIPSSIPIGTPLGGRTTYVLDECLNPAPIGVIGELCIGGELLARGYRGQAMMTAERFIADPFSNTGGRLYRTGDLARYQSDGTIEYVGRIDHQVKIRGFRIELGEIESQLQANDAIRDAVVLAQEGNGGQQLVAYIIPNDSGLIEADNEVQNSFRADIKNQLQQVLPEYMVPAHMLLLEQFPLTPNGKLDRKALPKADASQHQQSYVAPSTILEKQLATIWQELLGVEQVGLNDNFFELGGHSLLAVQMITKIKNNTPHTASMHDVIFRPTIKQLADYLCHQDDGANGSMVRLNTYQGNASPLFCIHPAGGNVYPYYSLALTLNNQRPVFGIMNRSYIYSDWFDHSWDDMVQNYLACIRKQQAKGPYLLLGWSSGGLLAMDIAYHLEMSGEEVSFLGLLDTRVVHEINEIEIGTLKPKLSVDEVSGANKLQDKKINIDRATEQYLSFVANIFPSVNFKMLLEQYKLQKEKKVNKENLQIAITAWIAKQENILPRDVENIRNNNRYQDEMDIVDKIQQNSEELEESFVFKDLNCSLDCWWANFSLNEREIEQLEHYMGNKIKNTKFRHIDAWHEDFVYSNKLLNSIKEVLLDI
ncbi:MAG: amino acid adenylation domain-containing protein, partial [Gammaproteobacteria bacterium]|nr:amino acid adenylation domain-containing protein [Gammaproteobacteria bacterium]